MKNKPAVGQERQVRNLDWLQDQEDDFLVGKAPNPFSETWEDEE